MPGLLFASFISVTGGVVGAAMAVEVSQIIDDIQQAVEEQRRKNQAENAVNIFTKKDDSGSLVQLIEPYTQQPSTTGPASEPVLTPTKLPSI